MNTRREASPSYIGLTPATKAASRAKRSNRARNTLPELILRRELWSLGLRYRIDARDLPGRPDLVFRGQKVAVFCDGDFWHGRNWETRRRKLESGWNSDYWLAKIETNMKRDRRNNQLLENEGWHVVRLWESDIKREPAAIAKSIQEVIESRRNLSDSKTVRSAYGGKE